MAAPKKITRYCDGNRCKRETVWELAYEDAFTGYGEFKKTENGQKYERGARQTAYNCTNCGTTRTIKHEEIWKPVDE